VTTAARGMPDSGFRSTRAAAADSSTPLNIDANRFERREPGPVLQ
jgi:hypothetical protein